MSLRRDIIFNSSSLDIMVRNSSKFLMLSVRGRYTHISLLGLERGIEIRFDLVLRLLKLLSKNLNLISLSSHLLLFLLFKDYGKFGVGLVHASLNRSLHTSTISHLSTSLWGGERSWNNRVFIHGLSVLESAITLARVSGLLFLFDLDLVNG